MVHLYGKLEEDNYVRHYLATKGLKYFKEDEVLLVSDCPNDTNLHCQRVVIDWEKKHVYYFTQHAQSYYDWNQQIFWAGYEYKGETQIAGLRKTRYRLRGNNIMLVENLHPLVDYRYSLEIYDDY